MSLVNSILEKIVSAIVNYGVDWIITIIITYFTVKSATRQYYVKTRKNVARNIMEQGLRSMLKLDNYEELPDNAKVIFVEYKGRCYKTKKKSATYKDCKFFEKIRKTVVSTGGDTLGVSLYRPLNYGVLGIANELKRPILFDFKCGELYKYENGEFEKVVTQQKDNLYVIKTSAGETKVISEIGTYRDIMLAVPIEINGKLVGGITFDLKAGAKTIYQRVDVDDSDKLKEEKYKNNIGVLKVARRTVESLIDAYFMSK